MNDIHISEGGSHKQFEKDVESHMSKQIEHFTKEISKLRTGRANPSMVEELRINAYGSLMSLKEIAAISAPEAQLLVIQPWDKSLIVEVEKAIMNSDLNLNPRNDGNVIRIQIPPMSKERRQDLIKVLHQKLEGCKVAIRNTRKDILNFIRDKEKSKDISEDTSKRIQDVLQKITNNSITQAEQISQKKEQEVQG